MRPPRPDSMWVVSLALSWGVRRKASSRYGPDASEHKLTICVSWLRINADIADGPAGHGRAICSISFTEHLVSLAGAQGGT